LALQFCFSNLFFSHSFAPYVKHTQAFQASIFKWDCTCYQPISVDNEQNAYCSWISAESCRTDRVIRTKDRIRYVPSFLPRVTLPYSYKFFRASCKFDNCGLIIDQCSSLSSRIDKIAVLFAKCDKASFTFFFLFLSAMLLRGIAFAEARRNSARRVFKNRDKTQGNGSERDAASDLSHDGTLVRHVRTVPYQPAKVPRFPDPFRKLREGRKLYRIRLDAPVCTQCTLKPLCANRHKAICLI